MRIIEVDNVDEADMASLADGLYDDTLVRLTPDRDSRRDSDKYNSFRRYGNDFVDKLYDDKYERDARYDLLLEIKDDRSRWQDNKHRNDRRRSDEADWVITLNVMDYHDLNEVNNVDTSVMDYIISDDKIRNDKRMGKIMLWDDYEYKDEAYYERLKEYVEDGDVTFTKDGNKTIATTTTYVFPKVKHKSIPSMGRENERNPLSIDDRFKIKSGQTIINNTTDWIKNMKFY